MNTLAGYCRRYIPWDPNRSRGVPVTGKTVAADYAYCMGFDQGRIKHMTKIWNDTISLQQLGWG